MTNDKLVKMTRIEDGYVLRLDPESIVEIAVVNDVTEVTYFETPEETVTVEVFEDLYRICHRIASETEMYGALSRSEFGGGHIKFRLNTECTSPREITLPAYLVNRLRYDTDTNCVFVTVHSFVGAYATTYSVREDFIVACAQVAYSLGYKSKAV